MFTGVTTTTGTSRKIKPSSPKDLTINLRILLVFGRIIGVVPYEGVTSGKIENLKFRLKSFGALTNCVICCFMAINAIVGALGFFKSNERFAQGLASNAVYTILYMTALFNYLFFLLKAYDFLRILSDWKAMTLHLEPDDRNLTRDITAIVICIYASIILENASWHVKHIVAVSNEMAKDSANGTLTKSAGEYFYRRTAPLVAKVLPYHPVIMGIIFITNKLCLYSREFGDIFIIVISRAIYYKFKLLIQSSSEKLFVDGVDRVAQKDPQKWRELISDFNTLLNMLSSFERFLSPLLFLSFSISIYYISLRLCVTLQIQETLTLMDSMYANWAFLHGIVRCYLVALSAAKINEHALNIHCLLAKLPHELYSTEIQQFENKLKTCTLGLSGFGCFTVTKPFMLKIIGVIFTVEIILLQSTSNSNCN